MQVSVLYKQFFAGELEVLCSMPEFWRKVTILYSGGDDFAVYGAWDALIALARELQRLFHRFTEENLKDFPGPEGKTISMAPGAGARRPTNPLGRRLRAGRPQSGSGQIGGQRLHLRARPRARMEAAWQRRGVEGPDRADDGRSAILAPVPERAARLLRKDARRGHSGADPQLKKVWRFHRRLNRILGSAKDREFQKQKTHLIGEIVGPQHHASETAAGGSGGLAVGQTGERGLRDGTRAGSNREPRNRGRPGKAGQRRAAVKAEAAGARRAPGRPAIAATIAAAATAAAFEGPPEIELEKLISDSLYLDNQAHGVVSRMRDMDSGTKSQLRRLYNAVRRAYRAAGERAAARIRHAARAPGVHHRAALAAQPGPDRKAAAAGHPQERSARLRTFQGSVRGHRGLQRVRRKHERSHH